MKKELRANKKKKTIFSKRKSQVFYSRFSIFVKFSMLVLLIVFIFTNFFQDQKNYLSDVFYQYTAKSGFAFSEMVISGQKNTSSDSIIGSLNAKKGDSIFQIDITSVKEKLETEPWVKIALVERRLPNTISIAIIEKMPNAVWQHRGKLYLIDKNGDKIADFKKDKVSKGVIQVVGSDANIYAQNLKEDLSVYPEISKKISSAVRFGGRRWNLNFQNGVIVRMPENDFGIAYKYLKDAEDSKAFLSEGNKEGFVLDLRDPKKYYFKAP